MKSIRECLLPKKSYMSGTISSNNKSQQANSKGQLVTIKNTDSKKSDSKQISNKRTVDSQQNQLKAVSIQQNNIKNTSKDKGKYDANACKKKDMTDDSCKTWVTTYQSDFVDHSKTGKASSTGKFANVKETDSHLIKRVKQPPKSRSRSPDRRYKTTITQSATNYRPQTKSYRIDDGDQHKQKSKSPRRMEQFQNSKCQYNPNNYSPTSYKSSNITDKVHHATDNNENIYHYFENKKSHYSNRNGRISPIYQVFDKSPTRNGKYNEEQYRKDDQFDWGLNEHNMAKLDQIKSDRNRIRENPSRKLNNYPTRYRKLINTQYEGTIIDNTNKVEEEISYIVRPDKILVRSDKRIACYTSPQNIKSTNLHIGGRILDFSPIVPHKQCHTHDDGEAWEHNNRSYQTTGLYQDRYPHGYEKRQCKNLSNIVKQTGLKVECLSQQTGYDLPQSIQINNHKTDKLISQTNREFATYQDIATDSSRVKQKNHRYSNDDEEAWSQNKKSYKVSDNQQEQSKMKSQNLDYEKKHAKSKDRPNLKHDGHNIELYHFDGPKSPYIVSEKERSMPTTNHNINVCDYSSLIISVDQSKLSNYDYGQKYRRSRVNSDKEIDNENDNPNYPISQVDRGHNLINEQKQNEFLNNCSHTVKKISQFRDVEMNSELEDKNISFRKNANFLNSNTTWTNNDQEIAFPRSTVKSVSQIRPVTPTIVNNKTENELKLNGHYKVDKIVTTEGDNSFTTTKFQNKNFFLDNKRNVEQLNNTKAGSHYKPQEVNHVNLREINGENLHNQSPIKQKQLGNSHEVNGAGVHTPRELSTQSKNLPNHIENQKNDQNSLGNKSTIDEVLQVPEEMTGKLNRNSVKNKWIDNNLHCDKMASENTSSIIRQTNDVKVSIALSKPPQGYSQNDSSNERCDSGLSYLSCESSLNFSVGEKSGFKNTQGYCFLNSVLQILRGCKSFTKALTRYHNESRIMNYQESIEKKVFIAKFCKLMNDLKEKHGVEDSLTYIQNYFESSSTGDDVNKCFMNLLTVVNEVTREPLPKGPISNDAESKFKAFKNANNGFVFDCFFGQLEHRMTCETCQKSINIKYQLFKCLPLHVPISKSTIPLTKVIEMFFQKSKVEIDDPMICDCVNGTVNISSQCQITHSPKYLFIYLDRGSLLLDGKKKLTFIYADESLSINTTRGLRHYNLISVIDHIGTIENGHYYCKCNYETDNWWLLNDTQVQYLGHCNNRDIVSKNTIVFVFRKRKTHL